LHVRHGLERGLQELLLLGRRLRWHHGASETSRRDHDRGVTCAVFETEDLSEADGLELQVGVVRHQRFWSRLQVSFMPEEMKGTVFYNYEYRKFPLSEAPGISVFYKDGAGRIFHTYSCYGRGLDAVNGAYQLLDLVPKGRNEADLPHPMSWVRHHDKYDDPPLEPP